jgi:hypothetical protein
VRELLNLSYLKYMAWRHGLIVTRINSEWFSVKGSNGSTHVWLPSFHSRFRQRIRVLSR